jgi:hypothetical protein
MMFLLGASQDCRNCHVGTEERGCSKASQSDWNGMTRSFLGTMPLLSAADPRSATRSPHLDFAATVFLKDIMNQPTQPPTHRIPMEPRVPVLFEIDVRHSDWQREHLEVGHFRERPADGKRNRYHQIRLHDNERNAHEMRDAQHNAALQSAHFEYALEDFLTAAFGANNGMRGV